MAQPSDHKYLDQTARLSDNRNESGSSWSFKFNAAAPEFVPSSHVQQAQVPLTGYFYPYFQYLDGTNGSWIYINADQETTIPMVEPTKAASPHRHNHHAKEIALTDELKQKIIQQAEYMFSDLSLLANETLAKHVSKDPEGFVPINFVTTTKKLKSLNVNNQMVAQALRSSSNLVISNDGKKVRRKTPFTDKEKEDLQLRTVIAENLPEDHSHQNLEKIFNAIGCVKSIRICQPQEPNSSRSSKCDSVFCNKLHALVEYENFEAAEKAAEKLNDERNWRKGMRVRVLLKRSVNAQPKSVLKNRKPEFDPYSDNDDEGTAHQLYEETSRPNSLEAIEMDENSAVLKRSWSRNRGKPKNRPQLQSTRSLPTPSSLSSSWFAGEILARQATKGPRMPDGTRGFTMGRGKPLCVPVQSS